MTDFIYDPVVVEKKWQQWWDTHHTNEIDLRAAANPYYVLMMFPYPSAEGLHVGNVYAFTGADVTGRHRRLRGHDVFEPIGFDAFGIHSENFAMKINRHPAELIPANIANFTHQLRMMGLMYDWRRTVDTTSPEYYRWTQWIFLQLYKAGLAYRDEKEVNFCPDCGTVIADEQVNPDGTCERHSGTQVQRRKMPCWFFRITQFADRLEKNLDWIDWSEKTKLAQKNWIGRSEGAEVDFQVAGRAEKIRVYTTRPDTLFGATFMVLAVDHPLVDTIAAPGKKAEIASYRGRMKEGGVGVSPANLGVSTSQPDKNAFEGGVGVSPANPGVSTSQPDKNAFEGGVGVSPANPGVSTSQPDKNAFEGGVGVSPANLGVSTSQPDKNAFEGGVGVSPANLGVSTSQPDKNAFEGGAGVSPALGGVKTRQGHYLPHWTSDGSNYHVVFRLADSLPQSVLDLWKRERDSITLSAQQAKRPLTEEEERRLDYLHSEKVEKYLDQGTGECILRKPAAAQIVADALKHFDGSRYRLISWCVMPNHVHVVMQPLPGNELEQILHSWKSFTAHEVNKALGRTGVLWQEEYFDHLIRTEESLSALIGYVLDNPEKARLKDWQWRGRAERSEVAGQSDPRGRDAHATLQSGLTVGSEASSQSDPRGRDARATLQKTGVYTGADAINPVNGEKIPIYISDYVLTGYGTGAIMAVPAHDERDFEFAQTFNLPIRCVIRPDEKALAEFRYPDAIPGDSPDAEAVREEILKGQTCWSGAGVAMNSANAEVSIDGLAVDAAKAKITAWLAAKGIGTAKTTFRLRDWGISRQRYWGPPIPILYDEQGNMHPVPEDQLPVLLPPTKDFRPKGDGRGPLANVADWVNVTVDGKQYRRETDVMDNFLDSAWYYLRYLSNTDDKQPYDPELIKKWLPLDVYIGGNEHAVLHLLYTRFICMALDHAGVLKFGDRGGLKDHAEPFQKFRAHGLLIKEGSKMSKSKGNVVNPDEYVEKWGADTLRLYLMFLGPYQQGGDFRDTDIVGMRRFLNRLYQWYNEAAQPVVADDTLPKELRVKTHQTIKKVREDIDNLSYNTAISAIMELFNAARDAAQTSDFIKEAIILALAPLAPHFAEEIWQGALKKPGSVWKTGRYPEYIDALTRLDEIEIVLQHNGKIRDKAIVPREATKEQLEAIALANEKIKAGLAGNAPKKIIVVPGRLVNIIG